MRRFSPVAKVAGVRTASNNMQGLPGCGGLDVVSMARTVVYITCIVDIGNRLF